jgi:O-glycosyl hydrolase
VNAAGSSNTAGTGGSSNTAGTSNADGSNTGGSTASGGSATSGGSGGSTANGGSTTSGGGSGAGNAGSGGSGGSIVIDNPNVTIDRSTRYQTIDGFGFFGARDDWWGNASDLWADDWGTLAIHDLGATIWRSEYYSEEPNQDANFAKQKPVVQGFKKIADANNVNLKFIFTVWSPPSSMKCTVASVQAGSKPCTPNPDGLKNGGTLDPSQYGAYADWLIQGIKNYADAGVDLYALSPQNEPMFVEDYNSAVYDVDPTQLNAYSRMIEAVAPKVKQAYPNVKIFGTENMLELEGQEWFYSAKFDDAAWANFDVLAYHGYQDGVAPTAASQLATYWNYVRTNWAEAHDKPSWMTETSGYTDVWTDDNGARNLGYAIYSALNFGHASAWVWWQGSELGGAPGQYTLMGGTQYLGKRYYVSKNFYRYIRPGAQMLKVTTTEADLFLVAFTHPIMNSFTIVAINTGTSDKTLGIGGSSIPATFDAYRTSASEDCASVGSMTNGQITLKADSITTLVNGNVYE